MGYVQRSSNQSFSVFGLSMQILNKLTRQSTFAIFILSILTLGLYQVYYMQTLTKLLNEELPENERIETGTIALLWAAVIVSALIRLIELFDELSPTTALFDLLLRFGVLVALSVWQFAWRKRFYAVTDTPKGHAIEFEGLYILLFGSLYINAKLNSFRDKPITTS
jgi:hypothetical protein